MQKQFFTPEPRIFAHRGNAAHFPENTLPSFQSAVEIGADVIETDVQRSRDGHFMVFHDDTIDRITEGAGRVGDHTLEELKRLDAGYRYSADGDSFPFRGKRIAIPSLDEALHEFPQQRFNVDLKTDDPSQAADYCTLIRRCNAGERVLTASEFTGNLKAVRSLMPEMATSASHKEVAGVFFLYRSGLLFTKNNFAADALQIPEFYRHWHVAAPDLMRRMHKKGIRVHVWTVNREADMRRLLDAGVDGIITDDPLLLKKVIDSRA
ncbi:MAG: glycerophosphodiester phosphodiesterase [Deltaproteobacteria bacterium]|nr:glycerophosphodiester phosphodiesterase [Deltaproteobacteria bacterium]